MNPTVCVVDDDAGVREAIESLLRSEGFDVELFASAQRFVLRAKLAPLSCVILDVELPGLSGLELQRELAEAGLEIPIIFLTGHGSIPMSVKAMKAGAVEFLTKPFEADDLLDAIQQAVSGKHSEELETSNDSTDMVGQSRALRAILNRVQMVAPTDSTVLIFGETGTGKEVIAKEIHRREPEFLTEPEMLRRERDNLLIVLEKADWKIKGMDGAAELLGVKPTTLLSRIKKMGLRRHAMAENSTRED